MQAIWVQAMLGKLIRPKLSLFVSLSAAAGYAAGSNRLAPEIFLPALACFLLASGASALNQWQERGLDALMSRTRPKNLIL